MQLKRQDETSMYFIILRPYQSIHPSVNVTIFVADGVIVKYGTARQDGAHTSHSEILFARQIVSVS